MDKKKFTIAQFGKTFGLKGELKLNLHTDFPEQFIKGRVLNTDRGDLEIEYYNPKKGVIKIKDINTPEDAKRLTNAKIYSDEEESRKYCKLEEGEHFWFDLIGSEVVEDGDSLGVVKEIIRMPMSDYFSIQTSNDLVQEGFAKSFLLPNIPEFIKEVDTSNKKIYVTGAKDILKES
ncbi:MAG: 16S rRNA processing protein RimM [Epsilonproteobacteria bacterium]|nr:16S rRNA processing protein RimM [Campylobacterota bacterium]